MKLEKIYFQSTDNLSLTGILHVPELGLCEDVIIATHGITSNCLKKRDDIIAQKVTKENIAFFSFNNRGHDIIHSANIIEDGKVKDTLNGSALEDISDSYHDIKGAILEMQKRGFKNIILQGHSLGCTKTVYTYNKFIKDKEKSILDSIKSIILLSMVDVVTIADGMLKDNKAKTIKLMERLKKSGKGNIIIMLDDKTPPVSPNTVLKYMKDNKDINFARYSDEKYDFKELNQIRVPLFMRWGNINELVTQDPKALANIMNKKIININKDIDYIDGASHNYTGKEEVLADQIVKFLKK